IKTVDIAFSQLPLNRVSPADMTLNAGYGNSADRAVLMAAMLKAVGLIPQFMLTSSLSSLKSLQGPLAAFPSADWFVSVLVCVETPLGRVTLGDTDQYAALGTVVSFGNPALNLTSGEIETIKAAGPRFEDAIELDLTIDLSPTGDAVLTQHQSHYGIGYDLFCKDYLEMTPEERRRRFQDIVSSVSRSAVALSPYQVNCESYPATDDFSVSVPGYATRQGDLLTLELPVIIRTISGVSGTQRSNPLLRDTYAKQSMKIEILLPEGVKSIEASPPEFRHLELPGAGEVKIATRVLKPQTEKGADRRMRIIVEQFSDSRPSLVLPEKYPGLLGLQRSIANPGLRTIVVRLGKD
ncbi:MAG TPA: hypothetical protein VMU10_09350, partial [Desulfomonilia bacterium]|nr:hypothetical protein [Desulfomonilia bacterium]